MTRVAGMKSGTLVTGLVAAALAAVCVLAVQAAGSPADLPLQARAARAQGGGGGASAGATDAPPARSGTGERVVYSIARQRVWLVGPEERVRRTFPVVAGDVAPSVGTHRVYARRATGTGGDGAPVEHVVLFAVTGGANIGFSAATDSAPRDEPAGPTAAIRERRSDAAALWVQATIGSTVEVVP
ncbi:hypothetical protein [Streptomyces sp.]|uniref:hypothetical protein n=1 Tax=Streptomyces sp. TaxID=1931 RepID=UPI002F4270F9